MDKMTASLQRYCHVYKTRSGRWYLELANREHGERDDASTYGPFNSEDEADRYTENFSNPGGSSIDRSGREPDPNRSPNGDPVEDPKKSRWGSVAEKVEKSISRRAVDDGLQEAIPSPVPERPQFVTPRARGVVEGKDMSRRGTRTETARELISSVVDPMMTMAERVAAGAGRTAAIKDLADIKELLSEMHEKQEEVARKQEEYRNETNRLWQEATRDVHQGVESMVKEIQKELVLYFKGNKMGVRTSDARGGLVEVFIGNDDNDTPDIAGRYQSKVSANISMTFKESERASAMLRNENLDETVTFDLKDKGTVAALMQEVKKADKKGFWKLDEEPGPTIYWRDK